MNLARELVRLALEAEGAVVEDAGQELYALLPAAAAARLSLGEETRVAFGAGTHPRRRKPRRRHHDPASWAAGFLRIGYRLATTLGELSAGARA